MNALLQHRGHNLMGAGRSIAVQNFNENTSILVMIAVYSALLAAINLSRGKNVYIANVLKCRPPGNRNPTPEEVGKCTPHLLRQIELIQPKLILAMGRFAAQTLLDTDASIASLRGRVHRYAGVPLIVTYHPAYLLRTLEDKAKAWEDLVFARRTMQGL